MARPDFSNSVGAVVVNYNAGELLARCLASLEQDAVAEVVVVDNGSTDGSTALVQDLAVPSRLIRSPRNGGYGAGANLGARASDREFLFICNPDLVAEPGAISCLAEALDARPDAAVAGPMLLETDGSVYPSGRTFPDLGDALGHGFVGLFWRDNPWTRRYRLLGEAQHRARDADWVSGAGFLVRRQAFEAVGASCTSKGVRPRAAPTGCSLPTTGRSSGLPAAPARAANGSCCLSWRSRSVLGSRSHL